jgi:hypothetical protein
MNVFPVNARTCVHHMYQTSIDIRGDIIKELQAYSPALRDNANKKLDDVREMPDRVEFGIYSQS